MKYSAIILLAVCVMASPAWAGLEVGQTPKKVELRGNRGGRLDGSPWSSRELTGKVQVVFYVDPDENDLNDDTSYAISVANFPRDQYQTIAIINMSATWLPNFAISAALEEKQKQFPDNIYIRDNDKILVKEWDLADDSSNVLAFDKEGKLIFMRAGKLFSEEIKELVGLIRNSLTTEAVSQEQTNANVVSKRLEAPVVPRSAYEAARWYREAADQGDAEAMVNLGDCYLLGRGIEKNLAAAQGFYAKAAELGNDDAQKKMRITAMRGYLRRPLNVRSDSGNTIVSRNEYVIFLPETKRLLYPHEGDISEMAEISEGSNITIETEVKEGSGTAEVHIMFKTDFLIKKLLLDGASIPFDSIETSDAPKFIKAITTFTISDRQLADGFAMALISRENAEHVRRLEYRDGTLKVISSRDLSNF